MFKNEEKITKEFCRGKILVFYPKTIEEAEFIQLRIFEMGYIWGRIKTAEIRYQSDCVENGMELDDGTLYTHVPVEDKVAGLLCTSSQFDKKYQTDRDLLQELFNQVATLAKKLDDIANKVDTLYEDRMPKVLSKSPLL